MNWSIVPVEKTFLVSHQGLLLTKNLEELAQGPQNVVDIHPDPPGHVVGVDQPLRLKEDNSHLLRVGGMNLDCCLVS